MESNQIEEWEIIKQSNIAYYLSLFLFSILFLHVTSLSQLNARIAESDKLLTEAQTVQGQMETFFRHVESEEWIERLSQSLHTSFHTVLYSNLLKYRYQLY